MYGGLSATRHVSLPTVASWLSRCGKDQRPWAQGSECMCATLCSEWSPGTQAGPGVGGLMTAGLSPTEPASNEMLRHVEMMGLGSLKSISIYSLKIFIHQARLSTAPPGSC